MKEEQKDYVMYLLEQASASDDANDALKYTQSALNAAHSLEKLRLTPMKGKSEKPLPYRFIYQVDHQADLLYGELLQVLCKKDTIELLWKTDNHYPVKKVVIEERSHGLDISQALDLLQKKENISIYCYIGDYKGNTWEAHAIN